MHVWEHLCIQRGDMGQVPLGQAGAAFHFCNVKLQHACPAFQALQF